MEFNRALIEDNLLIISLTILATISYVIALFTLQLSYMLATVSYIIVICIFLFKKMPVYSIFIISVFVLALAFSYLQQTGESNYIVAGLTGVLILVTFWYAYNTDRQFKVTENDRKGKYIAELSRSIFSPMQSSFNEARENLISGKYVQGEKPIQIRLAQTSPLLYLTQNVEIVPERKSGNLLNKVTRPATFLLKIKSDDEILRYKLGKIEELCRNYDRQSMKLQRIHLNIEKQFPSVLPDFRKFISQIDPDGLKHLFDTSDKKINYENNVLSKIFLGVLTHQRSIEFLNYYDDSYLIKYEGESKIQVYCIGRDSLIPEKLPPEGEHQYSLLKFVNENRGKVLEWSGGTDLAHDVKQLMEVQQDLLSAIDQSLEKIDSLLLNWKLNYYLVEDEMHG